MRSTRSRSAAPAAIHQRVGHLQRLEWAQWDSNVVPMVNDTSFGGNSSLKPTQKALLNVARLDKASYGGLYATGNIEPVAALSRTTMRMTSTTVSMATCRS